MSKQGSLLWLFVFGLFVITVAGCEMNSRGAQLFQKGRCKECHTINGKGGAVGPNLSNVGSRRSREYIIQQIKNPESHNPNTVMPSFRDMPEQDINDLADYLSHLK